MSRKHLSQAGKLLFIATFVMMVAGYGIGIVGFGPITILCLFLLSFMLMALGSRVGDQQ